MKAQCPYQTSFLTLFMGILLQFCISIEGQCQIERSNQDFHFLLWPESNGWVSSATEPEGVTEQLLNTWHQAHLPTYLNLNLRVHHPQTSSLRQYVEFIKNHEPHCIEGDDAFVQKEINQPEILYRNILDRKVDHSQDNSNAELILRDTPSGWQGILGVVHPLLNNAGKTQIEYWKRETGEDPDWIAFYSADEVIRHLLAGQAGSIQAAALPAGAFKSFLSKIGREDISEFFTIIPLSAPPASTSIFLRNDVYNDLLKKTLIRETWFRNSFPEILRLNPFIFKR